MSFEEALNNALLDYINDVYKVNAVTIESWEEDMISSGYCETCYFEDIVIKIHYTDTIGESRTFDLWESFTELMRSLTDRSKK